HSFDAKRKDQLMTERLAEHKQATRERIFRAQAEPMTPEDVMDWRQESGAGRVGTNTKTGKKRISPLLNVEGNVLHGRFPGADPEGLQNVKINTWQRFKYALQDLGKLSDDEATLVQLQNRLTSMMGERRR